MSEPEMKPVCAMGMVELLQAALKRASVSKDPELAYLLGTIHASTLHLLEAAEDQHQAIDVLMAELCMLKGEFRPTQHPMWPAVVRGNAAIKAARGDA